MMMMVMVVVMIFLTLPIFFDDLLDNFFLLSLVGLF